MDNLKETDKHSVYDEVPVEYCIHCLSLAVMDADGTPYCSRCGSTDIGKANILDWEEKYGHKYAGNYLNKK